MNHFFVPNPSGDGITIDDPADVNHIRQVLRLREGDLITVSDGLGKKEYLCRIKNVTADRVITCVEDVFGSNRELPVRITLYQGLPKGDKMEWIIQKAVELGVYRIVPVATKRAVVKLTGSRALKKTERWNTIARSAAKQSKRSLVPEVSPLMSFSRALEDAASLDNILMPYENAEGMDEARGLIEEVKTGKSLGIFIGPEGGFEPSETEAAREAGARIMTLGHRILRTETAGMMLLSVIGFAAES